ncbi:hypothetical protein ACLKA6_009768 [Drosophila palustris]
MGLTPGEQQSPGMQERDEVSHYLTSPLADPKSNPLKLWEAKELQTVLVGVEAVMNSRPLGPLSQDPSPSLTPAHLLIGGSLIAPPAVETPDQQGLSCLKRWRLVSSLKRMLWQRWSREYIPGLQTHAKWHQQQPNLAVGDLVVVAEDNMPPQQWLVGRVKEVHVGQDGMVRVVDVKTAKGGSYKRAIHKPAPLPEC